MEDNCAEQCNEYYYDQTRYCKEMIVIQYNTVKYSDIESVVPYRDLLFADCSGSGQELTSTLPYTKTIFNDSGQDKVFPAILISGNMVLPNQTFQLLNKTIKVLDELQRPNYIVSLNLWLNIQDKSNFKRESGVFSYLTAKHKEYFTTYAHLLPFTQCFLLQYIPLGSISATREITDDHRNYSSNFVDYDWCTESCFSPGEQFPGCGHNCYAFNASEYDNHCVRALNKLFGDASNMKANGRKCNAQRTIVSQSAEYENSCHSHSGCFAINPAAVWVSLLPSALESKIAKYQVDNELPHEFGHTYNLPDHAGSDCFAEKTRSFGNKYKNGISLPYFSTRKEYKRDTMNSGTGDYTDYMFASYSDYNYEQMINYFTNSENHIRISAEIEVDPNVDYETTIVQLFRNMQDVQLYRINAYIPCVIADEPLAENPIKLVSFTSGGTMYRTLTYESENKIVALPQDFYPKDGYIIVEKASSYILKKFFIRNDALDMPRAFKAFESTSLRKPSSSTKIVNTQDELSLIERDPNVLIDWLSEFDGIDILFCDGVWMKQLILHPPNIKCINKPIRVKRDSSWPVDVFIYPDITETIEINNTVTYRYCNGWKQY